LDGNYEQIEVIPEQIANLTCLQNLYLSDNRIAEFPIQLCDMKHITQLHLEKNPVDLDDPVLKMKREERDKKTAQKHSDIQRASSGWEEHEAQVLMMRTISSKQDEERMIQRKLRLGDRTKIE
jgi:Leucine-rich repeat (LRR) protein